MLYILFEKSQYNVQLSSKMHDLLGCIIYIYMNTAASVMAGWAGMEVRTMSGYDKIELDFEEPRGQRQYNTRFYL